MNIAGTTIHTSQESYAELEGHALNLLRKYTGKPNAQWTSTLQWQAISQVYQAEEDIVVITATGSGKTMIAILPTLLGNSNELALVFLPLISLITDYKRRFDAMKIPYDTYPTKQTSINPYAKFLLISADVAMSPQWTEFLIGLTDRFDIRRLIFDESHIPMISTNYRKIMSRLDQLRIIPIQIVLLTGTCPPSSEARMMELFGLEPASTVIFRGCTDRPELEYIRMKQVPTTPKALEDLDRIIQRHRRTAGIDKSARVVIFVPFINNGTHAAEKFNCDFYHSKASDHDPDDVDYHKRLQEKEEIYNAWYQGKKTDGTHNDIIVATTALSAGNDYPSVRLVVHLNTPYEMISYVQEVSRAGRDGAPAKCILIPVNTKAPKQDKTEKDYKGLQEMHDYVFNEAGCLRYAITKYCDGVGVYCYNDPKRQRCSLCAAKSPAEQQSFHKDQPLLTPIKSSKSSLKRKRNEPGNGLAFTALAEAARKRKARREEGKIEYVATFEMALGIFNSSCAFCLMNNAAAGSHGLTECPKFKKLWDIYKTFKNSIHYPPNFPNKSCFYCHVPLISNLLHPDFGKPSHCSHPDVVPVVAFEVYMNPELHKKAKTHYGVSWKSVKDYGKWLVMSPTNGSLTHISDVFLWYTKDKFNVY
jgi:superfamily II DNA helicase RecQ